MEPWLAYGALLKADLKKYFDGLRTSDAEAKLCAASLFTTRLPRCRLCLLDKNLLDFSFIEAMVLPEISQPFGDMFIEAADGKWLFSFQEVPGAELKFCKAIIAHETSDGGNNIYCWGSNAGGAEHFLAGLYSDKWQEQTRVFDKTLWGAIDTLFKIINSRQTLVGEAAVNHRFERFGAEPHRVRRIVVFKDKNKRAESTDDVMGREVDWKHTWEVMGHWRKVAFVGKDRVGNYWVQGKTWVKPCVRGKGKLIVKTRLMKKHQGNVQGPAKAPA